MSVSDGIRFFKPLGELVRAMDRGWIRILVCRLLIHDEIREVLDNNIANYQNEELPIEAEKQAED